MQMGSSEHGTSLSMAGVPDRIPEPSQEIAREGEGGEKSLRSGNHQWPLQSPRSQCSQHSGMLLFGSPTSSHSHPGILIQNLSLCVRLPFSTTCWPYLLATDPDNLQGGEYIHSRVHR